MLKINFICIQKQCLTNNSRWLILLSHVRLRGHRIASVLYLMHFHPLLEKCNTLYCTCKTLSYNYVFILLYFYICHKKISTKHSPWPQSSQKPPFSLAFENKPAIAFKGIVWLIYLLLCYRKEQPVLRALWCIKQVAKKPQGNCKLSVLTSI